MLHLQGRRPRGYGDSEKWMNGYACFTLSDKEDRYLCSIHIHYIICEFDGFRIERAALQQPFARWCKAFLEGGSRRPVLRTCSRWSFQCFCVLKCSTLTFRTLCSGLDYDTVEYKTGNQALIFMKRGEGEMWKYLYLCNQNIDELDVTPRCSCRAGKSGRQWRQLYPYSC